ncbi:procathepsin L-like isoform X2 [Chiloscyllium plagiosum]|uniref:procathepsin L-like isoform X2 n=1 Tax=Chiloscyllium plagiosum TaxID=36176 RepID=UPI001CB7B0CB|nr:procathepsin L-like isoform X2 [Chiloscyllium plagiosum]
MNFWLFLGSVAVSILAAASTGTFDSKLDEDWKHWKSQHGNQYTKDEESYRRMIWEDNMRYIEQHNIEHSLGKRTSKMGMNKFAALTNEEFNKLMNGLPRIEAVNMTEIETDERDESSVSEESHIQLRTATVDWRREGLVTPVKNQGQCHSDWAFSATGAIEGQWAKRHGNLVSLSEQNLIDCKEPRNGCFLGTALKGFLQVIGFQGINSEETYPYTGKEFTMMKIAMDM